MANSIEGLSGSDPTVLPFAVKDRWIVTVESERRLVKVRHRTRWYAVARRKGHDDRRHWCASHADAHGIAQYMRQAFSEMQKLERFKALYDAATDWQRARLLEYMETVVPGRDGE